jgi:hypothetical protein
MAHDARIQAEAGLEVQEGFFQRRLTISLIMGLRAKLAGKRSP